jgi:hypothetical protein
VIAFLVGGLTLPGCQQMGDDRAPASSEPAPAAEAPADSGYPPLQSVPPRPQLSYTVEQQRQIVEALIADRENARYTGQVVRHRSGLSSLPPPPAPPEPAAPVDFEPAIAARVATEPEPALAEHETLADFIGALFFDEPAPAPVAAEPEDPDRASEPEALDATPDGSDRREPAPASTAGATASPADAPLPPARSAVAARLAASPGVIDALVDATVPQTPLPPEQSAVASHLAAAEQIEELTAAPVPALRPAIARSAAATLPASLPAPPPVKPIVPVGAPMPPTPAEKPADHGSAAADGARAQETASAAPFVRAVLIVADAGP